MNKQEVKEFFINLTGNLVVVDEGEKYIELGSILDMIDKIEPEKPIIPQFISEHIISCKGEGISLFEAINLEIRATLDDVEMRKIEEILDWLREHNNCEVFTRAWRDGYEVEKEKLYTVEIPNPHDTVWLYTFLTKNYVNNKIYITGSSGLDWKLDKENHLTESEIRKDFAWAWQFAEQVEEK